ncbi:hypothetical protein QNO07_09460 [Streptomyces sp. 549]|uniref:hypothetical protein n=1 Tax=Streptomyces sp. 549 TaxID=3049076 RepID=UPI0024C2148E|nr:hypothetical protein [Streptomyces sp. 549]MDK1473646.1 hypothetical protein [Streptomyces sp. 549]
MATANRSGMIDRAVPQPGNGDWDDNGPVIPRIPRPRPATPASVVGPFGPQTRAALIAEFRTARDTHNVIHGRAVYRAAAAHDDAYPGEPSLVDELIGHHIDALTAVA